MKRDESFAAKITAFIHKKIEGTFKHSILASNIQDVIYSCTLLLRSSCRISGLFGALKHYFSPNTDVKYAFHGRTEACS